MAGEVRDEMRQIIMEALRSHCRGGVLPDQLRGRDDSAAKGFIHHSIVERLSTIVAAVKGFEPLSNELKQGKFAIRQLDKYDGGPDWEAYISDEIMKSGGSSNCLDVSWFFLENYMYRLVLGEAGFFKPNERGYLEDPWLDGKNQSLETALPAFKKVCTEVPNPNLSHLILCSLWGNRSDLSLSSGAVDATVAAGANAGKLLIDHAIDVEKYLQSSPKGSKIILVLDNCGAELLADLRMAWSLCLHWGFKVSLHVKVHPVFVSDATRTDVYSHVEKICSEGVRIADEVRSLLFTGSIEVHEDMFYTSPLEFPFAPERLSKLYQEARLVIFKGDANYRRILCDRHFPHDFSFPQLVQTTTQTPVLAIRTCKSPVIVGLDKHVYEAASLADPNCREIFENLSAGWS